MLVLYCPVYDNLQFHYNCNIYNDKVYCGIDPIKEIVNPCEYNSTKRVCIYVYLYKCFMQRKQLQGL